MSKQKSLVLRVNVVFKTPQTYIMKNNIVRQLIICQVFFLQRGKKKVARSHNIMLRAKYELRRSLDSTVIRCFYM